MKKYACISKVQKITSSLGASKEKKPLKGSSLKKSSVSELSQENEVKMNDKKALVTERKSSQPSICPIP